jgi:glycopeptide antibiotics resistance protein
MDTWTLAILWKCIFSNCRVNLIRKYRIWRIELKKKTRERFIKAAWLLFYLYIILLSYFLFFSEHYGRDFISDEYRYNLEFLKEIKRFIRYREQLGFESFVVNIMGNILAFAPFGFLLPLLNKRFHNFFIMTLISLLFSLAIESVQLAFKVGIFDVDDVLLNSIGGVIGYVAYAIVSGIAGMIRSKKHKRRKK